MKKIILFVFFLLAFSFLRTFSARAVDSQFTFVANHPGAINQSTDKGRILYTAKLYKGKIYWGYGDYGANSGPIDIMAFDPQTLQFSKEYTANTEAIYLYREFSDEKLYVPYIDPKITNDDYAFKDGDVWSPKKPVGMIHIFDIVEYKGKIYLIGSKNITTNGGEAVVYESSDGGNTFQLSLKVSPQTGHKYDFSRFYFAGEINNKLYVQAADFDSANNKSITQEISKIFDGNTWIDGPSLFPDRGYGYNANEFNNKLIYQDYDAYWFDSPEYNISGSTLYSFDGSQVNVLLKDERCYTKYGNALFAVYCPIAGSNCRLTKTYNLIDWSTISEEVPSKASSIVIDNGLIFVGTTEGKIYKSNFNLKDLDKTFTFSLSPKWNLISFPIFPLDTTKIDSIFHSLVQDNKYFEVWYTETKSPSGKYNWLPYAYNNDESAFSDLDPVMSYFVRVREPATLTIKGATQNFTLDSWLNSLSFEKGWNMLGFPFEHSLPITTALKSIKQRYTKVAYFDNSINSYQYFYNTTTGVPAYLNNFTKFEPGKGYWIKIRD